MASMDVFAGEAFQMMSLTEAMNLMPFKPRLLGSLGIFESKPVTTTKVWVESKEGKLHILPTANRGTVAPAGVDSQPDRKGRDFTVPHVPKYMNVIADDIQNIRAFGSESELETIAGVINDRLQQMQDDHDATMEFHRVGALKGIVLDADNSTVIYNYYTEFGTSQQTSDWTTGTGDPNLVCMDVTRKIATALGNSTFGQIFALCGNTYFDNVVVHTKTKTSWERWRDGEFLRMSHLGPDWYTLATNGFMLQNIMFVNYRGLIGDVTFIPATEAYFFPTQVQGMYKEVIAPADFNETVNTKGKRFYAKMEPMPFDKGMNLHTQHNILYANTRPRAVIKSTVTVS